MKLSTKGKYGVAAMLDLAIHQRNDVIPLRSIAERQNISECYLEQLFTSLRKAGIVTSVRGSLGGYKLNGEPKDITVGAILRILEGSMAPVKCVDEKDGEKCFRADDCVTKHVWEKMRDSINEVVDGISLEDLSEEYHKLRVEENFMFYI